jgi:hypothetical protein
MQATTVQEDGARRTRIYFSAAVLFSLASAICVFGYVQGFSSGGLIGLPGREHDIIAVQNAAERWGLASLVFQVGSAVMIAIALPFDFSERRWMGYFVRIPVAMILSSVLGLLVFVILVVVFVGVRAIVTH